MGFQWHTDDERDWDHELSSTTSGRKSVSRRRWLQAVVVLLLVMIAGAGVWRSVQQRAERNLLEREQALRSSYALVQQAAEEGDEELLTTVLSGRDEEWTQAQLLLLRDGMFLAGAARPFGLEDGRGGGDIEDISWSPDLQEATVTSRYTYTLPAAPGAPVSLRQTQIYRLGGDRWLLSPPDEGFWGARVTRRGQYVQLSFHERDSTAAEEMLEILDEAAATLCQRLNEPCRREWPLNVSLEADAEQLWRLRDDLHPVFRRGNLALPSPSLVGEGLDPRTREALYRGYAVHFIVAALRPLLDYYCCAGAPFVNALGADLAQELGYGVAHLHGVDFLSIVDHMPDLEQMRRVWWGASDEPPELDRAALAATYIAFLQRQSGASTVDLLRALAETSGFWEWTQLFAVHNVSTARTTLEDAWREFLLVQANASQATLPAYSTVPEQALTLICDDGSQNAQHGVYTYDPALDRWALQRTTPIARPALAPTPGDDGVVVYDRFSGDPTHLPARLLVDDRAIPLAGDLAPAYILYGDPQGRYMPMWRVAQSGRTVDGPVLLDLTSCLEDHCEQRSLNGLPAWSPSGEQILTWTPETGAVRWQGRDFRSGYDAGLSSSQYPFWLDEDTAGLVSADGGVIQSVTLRQDGRWLPENLLPLEPVLVELGRDDGRNWRFAQIYAVDHEPWTIVGSVTLPESGAQHYFLARFADGARPALVPLTYAPQLTLTSPEALISSTGAWFAIHVAPEAQLEVRFVMHDLRTGQVAVETRSPYFAAARAHDWSKDGRWLARLGIHFIELATDSGDGVQPLLRRFVSSGNLQCSSMAWVNK